MPDHESKSPSIITGVYVRGVKRREVSSKCTLGGQVGLAEGRNMSMPQ